MTQDSPASGYGRVGRLLHWGVALLVTVQIVIALRAWKLPVGDDKFNLLYQHRSLGLMIFLLMVLRLAWRSATAIPSLPETTHAAARALARFNQYLLYALLVLLPLSGLLMSQSAGAIVSWYGLFDLPAIVGADEALLARMKLVHLGLNTILFAAIVLHVLGALRHWLWLKDGVFERMISGR